MCNQVSVDPVDDAGIDISHLEQRWNLGFLAPPSTQITSAMRQAPSESVMTTASPGLTCKKMGSDLGAATALAWSTDILLY